jgi:hypothetical protein
VVIFGVLKRRWWEARDAYERESGRKVNKTNFLSVYAKAHIQTLTVENIKMAFCKTGLVPFNPDVVTEEMMAPSIESSSHGSLPIIQSSPIRSMANAIRTELARRSSTPAASAVDHNEEPEYVPQIDPTLIALDSIATTSASFITSTSPLLSSSEPPVFKTTAISPVKHGQNQLLLDEKPTTHQSHLLQDALREVIAENTTQKERLLEMQATTVLHTIYVDRARRQLQEHENVRKKKKSKRIMSDGMPHLLDGDEFFNKVVQAEEAQQKAAEEKAARKEQREKHAELLAEWKREEKARKERNKVVKERWAVAVQLWVNERDVAKAERRKPGWKKPTLKEFQGMEKAKPRPKLADGDEDEEEEEEEEESGEEDDR